MALVLACLLTVGCGRLELMCVGGESRPPVEPLYSVTLSQRYGTTLAQVPAGAFILVREFGDVDAVRFTDVRAARLYEYFGCARYEVYQLSEEGRADLVRGPVYSGTVSDFPPLFPHGPWAMDYAKPSLKGLTGVGRYRFPSGIWVWKNSEVAVTAWTEIGEVNHRHEKLRWFRFDQVATMDEHGTVKFSRPELP